MRALRDAVAGGREGQAYLFSGPRGTGKTTSARILAKVLNCERPVDGEPCCECASCLDVERGVSYDVHELDAASNNGVEAMRDLIEKANLGTPGRHKVYILDEVHMLSKPAEATLLKTLEEPPSHVVFVLATTDPQKVSDTIRSRTQHLRFHLLPPDVLAEHVRWVAADAGLDVSTDAIDAAVTQGAGSARDTLSALELIANAGGALGEELTFDEFVEAFIEHDPGRALTAMARLVNVGHDPRTIAEGLVKHLRNGFLCLMAPDLVQLPGDAVEALAAQSQRLGAAGPRRRHRAARGDPRRAAPLPRPAGAHRGHARPAVPPASRAATTSPALAARVAKLERARGRPAGRPGAGRPGHRAGQARRARPAAAAGRRGAAAAAPAAARPPRPTAEPAAGRSATAARERRRPARGVDRHGAAEPARPHPGAVRARRGRRRRRRCRHVVGAERDPPGEVRAADRRRRTGAARGHRSAGHGALGVSADRQPTRRRRPARRRRANRPRRPSTSPTSPSRCSAAGRRCSNASPRRSPAPRLVGEDD